MASAEEWAAHTINLIRSRRLSPGEDDKMFKRRLVVLHPDKYNQPEQRSLNILVGDTWTALDTARKASIQQRTRQYTWNVANPTPWTTATPTQVSTPNHAGDVVARRPLGFPDMSPITRHGAPWQRKRSILRPSV